MSTPEATRMACDVLYQAMAQLDQFEDRPHLVSPTTRGTFEECYEMLAELAVAKGFIPPTPSEQTGASQGSQGQEAGDVNNHSEPENVRTQLTNPVHFANNLLMLATPTQREDPAG